MRRPFSLVALLALSSSLGAVHCLSQPTALSTDAGPTNTGSGTGTGVGSGSGSGGCDAGNPACNATNVDAVPPYITYMDDLTTHPGCSTAGLATRQAIDSTPAGYAPAVINGGAYKCAAKEYGTDDGVKPIIVLVHGNSSTPNDWETYVNDTTKTPMISETLVKDGYHAYASDVRFDLVPADTKNNASHNYDHGWAVPIVQSLLTNLFEQYPAPRMFNIAGFSIGPTVIRDALRRMQRAGLNPFSRIHALHFASGAHHGVSTYATLCGSETAPSNGTMAGLAACQLGDRANYVLTPFEAPLNGAQTDIQSFDTPCSDGNTAYGQTGVCGGNTVHYTTIVSADPTNGPLLDEFVSEASSKLTGATNMTVTDLEPGVCTGTGSSMTCQGYFFYPNFEHHFAAIRSPQGVAAAVAALETK